MKRTRGGLAFRLAGRAAAFALIGVFCTAATGVVGGLVSDFNRTPSELRIQRVSPRRGYGLGGRQARVLQYRDRLAVMRACDVRDVASGIVLDLPRLDPAALRGWGESRRRIIAVDSFDHSRHSHEEYAAGWPLLALWCLREGGELRGGVRLLATTDRTGSLKQSEGLVPLDPIWSGFLVDTAFWGGTAFVVWGAPGFVRRRVRRRLGRRRGRCAACGYDLSGAGGAGWGVCPECGGGGA